MGLGFSGFRGLVFFVGFRVWGLGFLAWDLLLCVHLGELLVQG